MFLLVINVFHISLYLLIHFVPELNTKDIDTIKEKTEEWLKTKRVEEALWRTVYKLVAKNYFVDVETELHYEIKNDEEYIDFPIKQRKQGLFQVRPFSSTNPDVLD